MSLIKNIRGINVYLKIRKNCEYHFIKLKGGKCLF